MSLPEKKHILIVDDESSLRALLGEEFTDRGWDVSEARSGLEGLEIARATSFDVVLSDIVMPGGNGIELVMTLRSIDPRRPLLFLYSGFDGGAAPESKRLGVTVFAKPFALDRVADAIEAAHAEACAAAETDKGS